MFNKIKEHYENGMRKMDNYTDAETALVIAKHIFVVVALIQAPLACAAAFVSAQLLNMYRESRRKNVY